MISRDTKFPNRSRVLDKRLNVQERPLIIVDVYPMMRYSEIQLFPGTGKSKPKSGLANSPNCRLRGALHATRSQHSTAFQDTIETKIHNNDIPKGETQTNSINPHRSCLVNTSSCRRLIPQCDSRSAGKGGLV
jgi:hypothetical protein